MMHYEHDQCKNIANSGKHPCPEFYRCSGEMVCEQCGKQYYDHPQHIPYHWLNIICNGDAVKL